MESFSLDCEIAKASSFKPRKKTVKRPPPFNQEEQKFLRMSAATKTMPRERPVAWGYARVSSHKQEQSDSIRDQCERIEQYFNLKLKPAGVEFGKVFAEPKHQSASKITFANRPAGKELLDTVRPKDIVIFDKLDRGFRSQFDMLQTIRRFEELNVGVVFITCFGGSELDTSSFLGRMILNILAGFAEFESKANGMRVKSAFDARRERGEFYKPTREVEWIKMDATGKKKRAVWRQDSKLIRDLVYKNIQECGKAGRGCLLALREYAAMKGVALDDRDLTDFWLTPKVIDGKRFTHNYLMSHYRVEMAIRELGILNATDFSRRYHEVKLYCENAKKKR